MASSLAGESGRQRPIPLAGRSAGHGAGAGSPSGTPEALIFAADMYAVQLDQLAALTGDPRSARAAAARWRELGYAQTARLSAGPGLAVGDQAGTRRLRARLLPGAARAVPARAHQGRRGRPAGARGHRRLPLGRRVLAVRAADQGPARGRPAAAPARRRGALAGRGAGRRGPASAGRSRRSSRPRPSRAPPRSCGRSSPAPGTTAARPPTPACPAARHATPARCTCARPPHSARCCAPGTRSARSPPGSRSATCHPAPARIASERRAGPPFWLVGLETGEEASRMLLQSRHSRFPIVRLWCCEGFGVIPGAGIGVRKT